jgi:MerR family transcriptional regulator, mercuric resistance operon regulatory protein
VRIKQMIQATGLSADTLRYYETLGVLIPKGRLESGYRIYDEECVKRAYFIRNCQTAGFTLSEIKRLIEFDQKPDQHSREDVHRFVMEKLDYIKERLASLMHAKELLEALAKECSQKHPSEPCPILLGLHTKLN